MAYILNPRDPHNASLQAIIAFQTSFRVKVYADDTYPVEYARYCSKRTERIVASPFFRDDWEEDLRPDRFSILNRSKSVHS